MSEMKTIDGFSVGDRVRVILFDDLDVNIECCRNTIGGRAFYGLNKMSIDSMAEMDDLYIDSFFSGDYKNGVDLYRESTGEHVWFVTTDMLYPKVQEEIDIGEGISSFLDTLLAGGGNEE